MFGEHSGGNYQYPLNEHVVVLLNELRPAQHKTAEELHGRLAHAGGVVHEAAVNATLHIQLKNKRQRFITEQSGSGTHSQEHATCILVCNSVL